MSTVRTFVLCLVLVFVGALAATAQSNDTIDIILSQDPATVGSAAYLALSAADLVVDETTPRQAFAAAVDSGWLDPEMSADDTATFGIAAHLLMQAFEEKGGLMYRIFTGPRYAAREFEYRQWVPDRHSPGEPITGEFLIRMAGSFLEKREVTP